MPRASASEIVSALSSSNLLSRKGSSLVFGLVAACIVGLGAAVYLQNFPLQNEECVRLNADSENNSDCIYIETVRSADELRRGLSGRESLPDDAGMLFDFGQEGRRCMWMRDMHFAIDMIWLDSDGVVVQVLTDIAPDTYPETFCADEPAQYVLEVNAGRAQSVQVGTGQKIDIQ